MLQERKDTAPSLQVVMFREISVTVSWAPYFNSRRHRRPAKAQLRHGGGIASALPYA